MLDPCIYPTWRKRSRILYRSLFLLYFLISWSQKDHLIANLEGRCGVAELSSIQPSILFSYRKSEFSISSKSLLRNGLTNLGYLIHKSTFFLLLALCPFCIVYLADTPVHAVAHWPVRFMFFGVANPCDRVLLLHGVASTRLKSRQINCVGRHQLLSDSKEISDKTVQKI